MHRIFLNHQKKIITFFYNEVTEAQKSFAARSLSDYQTNYQEARTSSWFLAPTVQEENTCSTTKHGYIFFPKENAERMLAAGTCIPTAKKDDGIYVIIRTSYSVAVEICQLNGKQTTECLSLPVGTHFTRVDGWYGVKYLIRTTGTTGQNIGILTIPRADRLTYKLFKFDIKPSDVIVGNAYLEPSDADKSLTVGQTQGATKAADSASSDFRIIYSIAILVLTFLLN